MSMQADPNSIEAFKLNIQDILKDILHLQNLARNTLLGIQNAYHPGSTPTQTEGAHYPCRQKVNSIHSVCSFIRFNALHSVNIGVGALPILHVPPAITTNSTNAAQDNIVPPEAQMIADATRSIQILFERIKRVQESAGTVANLLQAPPIMNAT
ncbi:hypothetical protein EV360DRAFT_55748 [Lentinula raphanica]|nr:hypothetical protein EV360DRAFT_55748 [Lentinula raphanica]